MTDLSLTAFAKEPPAIQRHTPLQKSPGRTLDPSESSGRAAVIERRVDLAPLWTDAF